MAVYFAYVEVSKASFYSCQLGQLGVGSCHMEQLWSQLVGGAGQGSFRLRTDDPALWTWHSDLTSLWRDAQKEVRTPLTWALTLSQVPVCPVRVTLCRNGLLLPLAAGSFSFPFICESHLWDPCHLRHLSEVQIQGLAAHLLFLIPALRETHSVCSQAPPPPPPPPSSTSLLPPHWFTDLF